MLLLQVAGATNILGLLGFSIHSTEMIVVREIAARVLLISVYSFTWLVAILSRVIPRRRWKPTGRIMVTGTFHNPNWYLSHITPLACSGVREVILIVDKPQLPLDRVRFVCPPKWLSRLLSRAAAKAIWMLIAGLRYRPDLYMGYHLGAGPCSALVAGKLLGRPACYQMTGGPVVIIGGGFGAVGSVGGALSRPSRLIEALAMKVVRQFELVVVRGSKAREFLLTKGRKGTIAVITGSVNHSKKIVPKNRDIHLIYVGRLSFIKQVHQYIKIVDVIRQVIPDIRAVVVGGGPLKADLMDYAEKLGASKNIEFLGKRNDVEEFLARSQIFVLTSKSEGLSIAMAEAMSLGTVPVVADIGELSSLVTDGVNGYLVEPNNIDEYARKIMTLLRDESLWKDYSSKAIVTARECCDIDVVSEKWRQHLQDTVSKASGYSIKDIWN